MPTILGEIPFPLLNLASACNISLKGTGAVAGKALEALGYTLTEEDASADITVLVKFEKSENKTRKLVTAMGSDGSINAKTVYTCHHLKGFECQVMYHSDDAEAATITKKPISLLDGIDCK